MTGDAMEVTIMGHVLTRIGNGLKDYSNKRKDNGMSLARQKCSLQCLQ